MKFPLQIVTGIFLMTVPIQPVERQQAMIRECFMMISKRSDRVCNFLEDVGAWSKDTKLVYRVYATLYFIFVVDGSESELGILDLIHVFVESLDHVFENVCELDLIFHTDKVKNTELQPS